MKRPKVHLKTIVAYLLTVAAIAASPGDSSPQFLVWGSLVGQGTLTGIITDKLTGEPIAGALVTIDPGGFTAVTNAAGIYKATVRAGKSSLTVSVPNRPPQSVFGVVVRSTSTATVNFALSVPVGTGILAGYVRNATTNEPIANATVSVSPGGKATSTDTKGRYELWLPAGTYTVSAGEACSVAASAPSVAVSSQALTTRDLRLPPLERGVVETLHIFASTADGENPVVLIQATDGDLYGMTITSGDLSGGTVFKVSTAGSFTVLHQFAAGVDGQPVGLIQGTDGDFYGITASAAFRMTPDGTVAILHAFDMDDEGSPRGLVQGVDGAFYLTTRRDYPSGAVFRMTPDGTVTLLHAFAGGTEGYLDGLIQGRNGDFYGTTFAGGESGKGTVFTMTPAGIVTVLHAFSGGADGAHPFGLIQASDGDFYGLTDPGVHFDAGNVFKMTPAGDVTMPHGFTGGDYSRFLMQAADGNLYGTGYGIPEEFGGGSIFRMTPAGAFATLHSFTGLTAGGANPYGGLVQGTDGNFYGVTFWGGIPQQDGRGTVFRFRPGGCQAPAAILPKQHF